MLLYKSLFKFSLGKLLDCLVCISTEQNNFIVAKQTLFLYREHAKLHDIKEHTKLHITEHTKLHIKEHTNLHFFG